MKKIFTLLTAALMAVTASAQGNIWKASSNLTAEQTLVDNDDLTVTAPYAATVTASTQTIGGQEFTGYFNMRTGSKPSATNKYGAQSSGRTSLVVEAKKKVKFSLYDSHNNSAAFSAKAISHEDFDQVIEPSIDDSSVNLYAYNVESFEFEPGTYTVYYAGAGLNVYGFSWAVEGGATTDAPAVSQYKYSSETTITAGTTVDAVPNCTLTFGATGGADFKAVKKADNLADLGYTGFCEGNGENGNYSDGPVGTVYELKPAKSGKITVAVVLNNNKAFYILEDGVALSDYDGIKVDEKYYGTYSFNVTGGKTYDVYCTGSKLGFFGFEYEISVGGEEPETPAEPGEGEVSFNVVGVGSGIFNKEFNSYVGAFDYDAKTRELTLKNFLGSNTNVVLKYNLANEGSNPDDIDTNFNSEAVSGLGTDGSIENFADGSFIVKEDGKNFMKLTNLKLWLDYNSQMTVTSEGSGTTAKKMLYFRLMVQGNANRYNEETKEWYPAKYTSGAWTEGESTNFVELRVSIPFDNGTSGIDNVVVDAEDENAPVEYYNLQGVRIAEPAAGQIVIRRQGSKVEKLLVR